MVFQNSLVVAVVPEAARHRDHAVAQEDYHQEQAPAVAEGDQQAWKGVHTHCSVKYEEHQGHQADRTCENEGAGVAVQGCAQARLPGKVT